MSPTAPVAITPPAPAAAPGRRPPRLPLWPTILGIGAASGLLAYAADAVNARECNQLGGCLTDLFLSLALVALIPVLTLVALLIARFPWRDFLLVIPMCFLGYRWTEASSTLMHWRNGFGVSMRVPAAPVLLWVVAMTACAAASWVAVRRRRTAWWIRVLAPLLVFSLSLGLEWAADRAERLHTAQQLSALTFPLYRPSLAGARFSGVSAESGGASIAYRTDDDFPSVGLSRADAGSSCGVAADSGHTCIGDHFVDGDQYRLTVGLRRGETLLVASGGAQYWSADQLLAALRAAPPATAEELAFAR